MSSRIQDVALPYLTSAVVSPSQLTGNVDNYAPTDGATSFTWRISSDASRNITGISISQAAGRLLKLVNIGSNDIVLKHDVTSTAANRFYLPGAADMTLSQYDAVLLEYDGTLSRWVAISSTKTGTGTPDAPASGPFLTYGTDGTLSAEFNIRSALSHNEFYWPPPIDVGDALDLDAANQWWDKIGTPTGGVIYTTATASSISTLYGEDLLKCVAASSGDGLKSTFTYANEKRVKSGAYMAVLCAVYLVTAGRTVTVSLATSTPTTIDSETVTADGAWTLVALEPGSTALDGASVDFKATLDGAGTFYVVPLGALISTAASPRALPLPYRPKVTRWSDATEIKAWTGLADEATWTDIDCTAATGALCFRAQVRAFLFEDDAANNWELSYRRNGSSDAAGGDSLMVGANGTGANIGISPAWVLLDDAQVFEYYLDRVIGATVLDFGAAVISMWEEWG